MEWEPLPNAVEQGPGSIVHISPRDNYRGYPTGMGGRLSIERSEYTDKATHLVELGLDWPHKMAAFK